MGVAIIPIIEKTKTNLKFWWTAWVELSIVILLAAGAVWVGATSNVTSQQWDAMTWWDRHKLYVAVFIAMINALKAFLSNTVASLNAKKEANGNGHTLTPSADSGTKPP